MKASDFKLSSNEAINLLRQFLLQMENNSIKSENEFPFGINPVIEKNQLTIDRVYEKINDAEELVTLVGVLENRGWKLTFH